MAHRLDEAVFLDRFIHSIFSSIASRKLSAIQKAASRDPEFQKIVADLERSRKDLEKWTSDRRNSDPQFKDTHDTLLRYVAAVTK